MFLNVHSIRQIALNFFPAVVYFFFALLILDGIRLIFWLRHTPFSQIQTAAGIGIAIILTIFILIYGALNARYIRPTPYSITIEKSAGGSTLRLALVSDLHIGRTIDRKWVANKVDAINLVKPDIVCLVGDIFDGGIDAVRDLEGVAQELKRLDAPLGVFACPGNHDVDRLSLAALREGATTDRLEEFFVTAGVNYLQDEIVLVDGRFYLAGRRDVRPIGLRHERISAAELVGSLEKSKPLIVMDHQPVDYPNIEEAGADLILSGHTHRGQFFPGNIATNWIFKNAGATHYGYWQGKTAQAVVTSGVGVWGPSIRIGTKSEVAVLNIKFGK